MADTIPAETVRKIYARGFYDALQSGGIGMGMSQAKWASIHSGLTSVSKKVYDQIPISEPWTIKQIMSSLMRVGSHHELKTVAGCIASLVESGVVREPQRGMFIRTPIKDPKATPVLVSVPSYVKEETTVPTVEVVSNDQGSISRLSDLSAKLRALADELDTAAIEIDEKIVSVGEETKKLRQLQKLLKELG